MNINERPKWRVCSSELTNFALAVPLQNTTVFPLARDIHGTGSTGGFAICMQPAQGKTRSREDRGRGEQHAMVTVPGHTFSPQTLMERTWWMRNSGQRPLPEEHYSRETSSPVSPEISSTTSLSSRPGSRQQPTINFPTDVGVPLLVLVLVDLCVSAYANNTSLPSSACNRPPGPSNTIHLHSHQQKN